MSALSGTSVDRLPAESGAAEAPNCRAADTAAMAARMPAAKVQTRTGPGPEKEARRTPLIARYAIHGELAL